MRVPRLAHKSIVVTGATGIAAEAAVQIAAEGAEVFIISNDAADCIALTERIESDAGRASWTSADLTSEPEAVEAITAAADRLGRIDGVYAVVGASGRRFGDGPLDAVPLNGWRQTMSVNVDPPFLTAREALGVMVDQEPRAGSRGSVVFVASVLARHPSPAIFATHAYAAAKGAIISMTRTVASYYAPS